MKKNKILILVPAITARGGITNYYQVLRKEFGNEVEYFERGARTWPVRNGFGAELVRAWEDYQLFKKRLKKKDVSFIQTTTSLSVSTTIRDGLFIRYAHKKGIKTSVFFRGWDDRAEKKINKKFLWLFKFFFFKADNILTLSKKSKQQILNWGYPKQILLETTLVDKRLLENVSEKSISEKFYKVNQKKIINILFMSRIEKRKGIYELLKSYKELTKSYQNEFEFHLDICGDGSELENIKNYIDRERLEKVTIHGFTQGEKKRMIYEKSHLFIFPSYGEGMPNAVLEAMGFGIPVITTKVGGLVDFFQSGKNGLTIPIGSSKDIVLNIVKLTENLELMKRIGIDNYLYAKEHFRSDKVAMRIMKIFNKI